MSTRHFCICAVLFLIILFDTTCSRRTQEQHISLQRHVFQEKLASSPVQEHSQITHQKGIVIPCGGARQLANAYVGLLIIRNYLSCDLPVEIAYYGTNEMDDQNKALFQVRGVVMRSYVHWQVADSVVRSTSAGYPHHCTGRPVFSQTVKVQNRVSCERLCF